MSLKSSAFLLYSHGTQVQELIRDRQKQAGMRVLENCCFCAKSLMAGFSLDSFPDYLSRLF